MRDRAAGPLARLYAGIGAAVLLSGTGASPVRAAGTDEADATAALTLVAPAACASPGELRARVTARAPRIRFVGDAAANVTRFRVVLAPAGERVSGEIAIQQPNGRASSRRLTAPSCAGAIDAVALVIALVLDPGDGAVPEPAAPATQATPPKEVPASAPQPQPAREADERRLPPAATRPEPVIPAKAPDSTPPRPIASSRSFFGGGVAGQLTVGPTPSLWGAALYLAAGLDRDSPWSPAAFLWLGRGWSGRRSEPGGTAEFHLDAATLDACALRLHLGAVDARACGSATMGLVGAQGSETYSPGTATRPFAAAGAAVLVSVGLGNTFVLSGRVALSASLVRDSYYFTPTIFHRAEWFTLSTGLAIGVRFP